MKKHLWIMISVSFITLFTVSLTIRANTHEININEILSGYQEYLSTLPEDEINSISLALEKFKSITVKDKKVNDELFRLFKDFYFSNTWKVDFYDKYEIYHSSKLLKLLKIESFEELENLKTSKDPIHMEYFKMQQDLQKNGLALTGGDEGSLYIGEDYSFFINSFSEFVSPGMKEFLKLRSKNLTEGFLNSANYIDIIISPEDLYKRINEWENFINSYPDYSQEIQTAQEFNQYYLPFYLTVSFSKDAFLSEVNIQKVDLKDYDEFGINWTIDDETKKSYQKFLSECKESKYYHLIEEYYRLLKQNDFRFNQKLMDYLISKEIIPVWHETPTFGNDPYHSWGI